MSFSKPRLLNIGGDPRLHPEFANIRNEMQKLTHPARPDVNWPLVSQRCLILFEQNGADLQTASWFTLALTHQHGLDGLRDGLKVTEVLISTGWHTLWPHQPTERANILKTLFQRLQILLRKWALENKSALSSLYECEKSLCRIEEKMKEGTLRALTGVSELIIKIRSVIGRLEQAQGELIPISWSSVSENHGDIVPEAHSPYPLVFIKHPDAPPGRNIRSFVAGMAATLAVVCLAGAIWHYTTKVDESIHLLTSVVPPLPHWLSEEERSRIRYSNNIEAPVWINKIRKQTEALDASGIGRTGNYSTDLALQAVSLWPLEDATDRLLSNVIARREGVAVASEAVNAWQQGMHKLTLLSEKLNSLDEKRGRYLTVSELKSAIFSATQAFSQHIPAEEWLRRYQSSGLPSEEAQLQRALDELHARYDIIRIHKTLNKSEQNSR